MRIVNNEWTNSPELYNVMPEDLELLKSNPEKFWEGVKFIGTNAFKECRDILEEIEIPGGVGVCSRAFYNCHKLKRIKFDPNPNSNDNDRRMYVEDSLCYGCSELEEVELADDIIVIGNNAFEGCEKLTSINLEGVTTIRDRAFSGCKSLKKIDISKIRKFEENKYSLGGLSKSAFKGTNLEEVVMDYEFLQSEDISKAFKDCDPDKLIIYAKNVREASPLEMPEIKNKLIDSINIDKISTQEIENAILHDERAMYGKEIFLNQDALKMEVDNVKMLKLLVENTDAFWSYVNEYCKKYRGLKDAHLSAIDNRLESIDKMTSYNLGFQDFFSGKCTFLEEIVIPEGVKDIGLAFCSAKNLKKVKLPSTVTLLSEQTFKDCKNLEYVDLGGIKTIYPKAFEGCKNLKLVDLSNVEKVYEDAFYGAKIEQLIVPKSKRGKKILEDISYKCDIKDVVYVDDPLDHPNASYKVMAVPVNE